MFYSVRLSRDSVYWGQIISLIDNQILAETRVLAPCWLLENGASSGILQKIKQEKGFLNAYDDELLTWRLWENRACISISTLNELHRAQPHQKTAALPHGGLHVRWHLSQSDMAVALNTSWTQNIITSVWRAFGNSSQSVLMRPKPGTAQTIHLSSIQISSSSGRSRAGSPFACSRLQESEAHLSTGALSNLC